MVKRLYLGCSLFLFVQCAWSISCFFTLVKDSCWTNYDVNVSVVDADTGKPVIAATVPKGQTWVRHPFDCKASEALNFIATFSPIFWSSDKGKHYNGKRTWVLPDLMKKGDTAWDVTVCYPENFSGVPMPPDVSGNCTCHADKIPKPSAPKS